MIELLDQMDEKISMTTLAARPVELSSHTVDFDTMVQPFDHDEVDKEEPSPTRPSTPAPATPFPPMPSASPEATTLK